nr:Glycyl-glycine endopeptidase ALE-1 [Cryobacterium sp. SO1]
MSDASVADPSDPSQSNAGRHGTPGADRAAAAPERTLTRREQRELERRAAARTEPASAADAASAENTDFVAVAHVDADVMDAEPAAGLSPEVHRLVGAELAETHLEAVVLKERDLALPAKPAYEQIPSDVSPNTTTTTIVLPSRAALRAQLRAASASDDTAPATAPAAASEARTEPSEPERTLPDFVPRARALPSAPKRADSTRSGHHRMRMLATKGGSIIAMSFVALMAVATSIPADALLSSSDVQAAALEAKKPTSGAEPTQVINLANGTDTITVEQDSYQSQSIAEVAAASGIRMEDTFSNNPNGSIQWPFAVGVHVGDQFGYRNCAGCSVNHGGQDFNPGIGAPIQAIADGVVSFTEDGEGSLGVHMIIEHMIDGKKVSSVYAHMVHGSMLLKTGDVVKVGQVIGKVGSTGMSTGPHLHFEIRLGGISGTKTDPLVWLYANTN